jgi:hypothetical protein
VGIDPPVRIRAAKTGLKQGAGGQGEQVMRSAAPMGPLRKSLERERFLRKVLRKDQNLSGDVIHRRN